jgi:hypothetical protein
MINNEKESSLNHTVGHGIRFALFVSMHGGKGMDSANPSRDTATLWTIGFDDEIARAFPTQALQVKPYHTGLLQDVNKKCKELEQKVLAPYLLQSDSTIRGLICISCEPRDINHASLSAAVKRGIPVCGSGGTSLSVASSIHGNLNLIGNSGGSVATTTYTRAVSYTYALASSWGQSYSPFLESMNSASGVEAVKPRIGSVLDACLPSFLTVTLACRLLIFAEDHVASGDVNNWSGMLLSQLQSHALPTVCAVVTATTYAPEHGSSAIMAASVASIGCSGSILSGLLSGRLVSFLVSL